MNWTPGDDPDFDSGERGHHYFFFAAGFFAAAFFAGAAAVFAAGFFAAVAIYNHHPSGVISHSTTLNEFLEQVVRKCQGTSQEK